MTCEKTKDYSTLTGNDMVFKITPEHQEKIKTEISMILAKYPDIQNTYEQGKFARADKVKDLQRRFCFDLLFATGLNSWICDNIYSYANDAHLYSFLKSICPKVERKY